LCRVVWYEFTDVSEVLATSNIALVIEAASFFETSVNFYAATTKKFILTAVRTLNLTFQGVIRLF
jgi:hypothetical protein